jgi:hypothetical protein
MIQMTEEEVRWRAREAIIVTGNFTEEQQERIRKGTFKPKILETALEVLSSLTSKRYVDPKYHKVREAVAASHPNRAKQIMAGHWDTHTIMRAAIATYELGRADKDV